MTSPTNPFVTLSTFHYTFQVYTADGEIYGTSPPECLARALPILTQVLSNILDHPKGYEDVVSDFELAIHLLTTCAKSPNGFTAFSPLIYPKTGKKLCICATPLSEIPQ